jgi:hypothetical protein
VLLLAGLCAVDSVRASLSSYDATIVADAAAGGLTPLSKLTNVVTFNDVNSFAFNFGNNSGDVTMEFILQGDPAAGGIDGYLAVGTNSTSNLRYEQYNDTGQIGFTQLGVADYLFSPGIPSPAIPVHIAYVWKSAMHTMELYLNGSFAGSRSGVDAGFAMPTGQGWLGNNAAKTEGMVGTIYRVTVYDDVVAPAVLQRHSDAYNDIARPPILVSFTAAPSTIFTPNASTLSWSVTNAVRVFINGTDVTALSNLSVSPSATTGYELMATNAGGSVTGRVTVVVNPAPVVNSFTANKYFVGTGQMATLNWNVSYADTLSIAPDIGDVTAGTVGGMGSIGVQPGTTTVYTLTVNNAFGATPAHLTINVVHPSAQPVISEFMADNQSTLADEDGQFSDWIELLNPTAGAVNLLGFFLTDDANDPTKWSFPNVSLAPGAYLIVWASGKNRVNPAAPLHTNFRLNKGGGYLGLFGPGPLVVHEFNPYPPQEGDVSYGILGGDPSLAQFMGVPTPGAENNATPAPPVKVQFSRDSGTFTDVFALTLTTTTAGAAIRYTLDGSMPGVTNGATYSAPLTISSTTRIRAVALKDGQSSKVSGESYIKLAAELANYTSTLPILVIENFGAGIIPQKGWSGNGSGIKQVPRQSAVWATFDLEAGGSALTNPPQMFSDIGIRGRGAFSSTWRQKPYSVDAVDASGEDKAVSPLGMPQQEAWVLYFPDPDPNKDPTLLFNTFLYELYRNTGHTNGVRFRWVEAFINEDGGDLRLADRRGVYAIFDKVSRGKDRLDFTPLSEDGASGSWLLDLNRMDAEPETGFPAPNGATTPQFFHTAGPNRILETPPNAQVVGDDEPQQSNGYLNFDTPGGYSINTNQRASIENWFKQFEDVLWNNAVWRDPVNGYRKYLDAVDFADYFVMNGLTHNGDGLLISMFPWKADDGKLRMGPAWDFNWSAYYISGSATVDLLWRSDRLWYKRLFLDPDFMQLYIDRWWDHRRGAMSNDGMDAIIDGQVAQISPEKAVLNGFASANDWVTNVAQMKTWLKTRANWIDSNYVRPPSFNQDGGDVPDGFQVTILGTNGTIYFTTDGSDPRASGGAVAGTAQAYQLPVSIPAQTMVQARIQVGTNWSGLTRAVFYPPQDLSKLVVTELMYNPPGIGATNGDEFEFLELKNVGTNTLNLGTLSFTAGISFTFTNGTRLAPGHFLVLVRNASTFASKYPGVAVNGIYAGKLDNGGETVRLSTPAGSTVLAVTYNDRAPWPIAADGYGFSLVPKVVGVYPNSDDGAHWRASSTMGGSPGADDPEPAIAPVLVNEVLTHSLLPEVDWIELYNPNAAAVNLGGWFLSDDGAAPRKFRIPENTMILAGGYRVFTEDDFNTSPGGIFSFSFNSAGDAAYLTSGDSSSNLTGFSHGFSFGAADEGVSFGRYVNSVGEEQFPAQLTTTSNGINLGPRVGPIVLSEIQYHPEAGGDEFVELRNITESEQLLYDPANPTNTWRLNGLGFNFPTNSSLPAQGVLLVVGTLPEAFRSRYGVPEAVPVLGPFAGTLQNTGERLELQRPGAPGTNGIPYITVDEVRYNDKAPWPPAADGSGASLQRKVLAAYGNDPTNWAAALPTPGADYTPGQAPSFLAQPQSQAVLVGQNASFQAEAVGAAPLFLQWLFNDSPIAGATNFTLLLANVQLVQAGGYSAVVYNEFGSSASATAQLTVNRPPTIFTHPTNQFIRPTSNAVFTVVAVGSSLPHYQWQRNGTNVAAATNATLTITNAQFLDQGIYTVIVSDIFGSTTSQPATLTLLIDPIIKQNPLSQSILPGAVVVLSVTVTNTATLPMGYRLRRNGVSLPVAPSTFLTLNQRIAFFTLGGTNTMPPWTNYAIICTNMAKPVGNLSASAILTYVSDADGDGLPDNWETNYFGATGANPNEDSDRDGMTNWQEYIAGTDPTDPSSYLRVERLAGAPGGTTLEFNAVSNHTYTILFNNALGDLSWSKLADVEARPTNRLATVADPASTTNRFYRLVTPQQP